MKLNAPKKGTFLAAVIVAAVGGVAYIIYAIVVHLLHKAIPVFQWMNPAGFVLIVIAFILLCLGLLIKGF